MNETNGTKENLVGPSSETVHHNVFYKLYRGGYNSFFTKLCNRLQKVYYLESK